MSGDKVSDSLRVQRNDANNTWIACVELPDGHRVHSENMDRYTAIESVRKLARHHTNTTITKPMISDQASNDAHTTRQQAESATAKPKDISKLRPIVQDKIARQEKAMFEAAAVTNIQIASDDVGLGYEIDPNSNYTVAQHASHLQKLMTGLIEKAKRENLDHRLIAMANTDFERGFMALEKAINTNKG